MSDRNPTARHRTDDTPVSVRSGTLPGVTADHTEDVFPKHIPVQPSGMCSIMCDHPGINREESHQAAVKSWQDEASRRAAEADTTIAVIDMWEINQRAMEAAVRAGQQLPPGITPKMVADWRAERGHGPAALLSDGTPVEVDPSIQPTATDLVPIDAEELAVIAEEVGADDRCPAATGIPADLDQARLSRTACPVHPDGAHRCYRRPTHLAGGEQEAETGGRLAMADHQCDCGNVWISLSGGLKALDHILAGQAVLET